MSEDGARPAIALGLREIGEYLIALAEAEEHAEIPEHRKLAKAPSNILDTDRLRKLAELLLKMRRSRSEWLDGDLFAEPAWDILLGSFVARTSGVVQLTKVATNWSNVPTTTSLRWIEVASVNVV